MEILGNSNQIKSESFLFFFALIEVILWDHFVLYSWLVTELDGVKAIGIYAWIGFVYAKMEGIKGSGFWEVRKYWEKNFVRAAWIGSDSFQKLLIW